MDEYLNYYMNKLDKEAQSHDDDLPLEMTLERAQALIAAHNSGVGMSRKLLNEAKDFMYWHGVSLRWERDRSQKMENRFITSPADFDIPTGDD